MDKVIQILTKNPLCFFLENGQNDSSTKKLNKFFFRKWTKWFKYLQKTHYVFFEKMDKMTQVQKNSISFFLENEQSDSNTYKKATMFFFRKWTKWLKYKKSQ